MMEKVPNVKILTMHDSDTRSIGTERGVVLSIPSS